MKQKIIRKLESYNINDIKDGDLILADAGYLQQVEDMFRL